MRVKEEFKRFGYFWLPCTPDRKVPGTLSISDGGIIELEVLESLDGGMIGPNDNHVKRIVGQVEKDGPVSLDDCSEKTRTLDFRGGILKSILHVSRAFLGASYAEEEIPHFKTVTFSVEGLDEWIGITGLKVDEKFRKNKATISYQQPAEISMNLQKHLQFSIAFAWTAPVTNSNAKEASISQKTYLKLVSTELRELDQFILIAHRFTKFLRFAMNEAVCLHSILATSHGPSQGPVKDVTKVIPIRIYYQSWVPSQSDSKNYGSNMLFGFKMIREEAERLINNWLDTYEQLAPTLDLYFWTQMPEPQYVEVKFLTLVQGLEVCHRRTSNDTQMDQSEFEDLKKYLLAQCPVDKQRWLNEKLAYGNELSLRKRIKWIIAPFKEIVGDKRQRSVLIHQIVIMRNYLTHRDKSLESEVAKVDLPSLYLEVELIFQLYLLRLMGLDREEIDSIVTNSISLTRKRRLALHSAD